MSNIIGNYDEKDDWVTAAFEAALSSFRERQAKKEEDCLLSGPKRPVLGPPATITDPNDLTKTFWAIITPENPIPQEQEQLQALQPLCALRTEQMQTRPVDVFYYRAGQTASEFLMTDGRDVERGIMNLKSVPYYLLIVASPERIPWEFQADLDAEYAVGRLWFDELADCVSYVTKRVDYETNSPILPSTKAETVFFATQHPRDPATEQSAQVLVTTLASWLRARNQPIGGFFANSPGSGAYRTNLKTWLESRRSSTSPCLFFSATHGMEFQPNHYTRAYQGALVCQDWDGNGVPVRNNYFAAEDVVNMDVNADFSGMLAYLFACFSGGAPQEIERMPPVVPGQSPMPREKVAPVPHIATLPQKLLARGMGAVIGHIDRAFTYSFMGHSLWRPQTGNFESVIAQLLRGCSIGHAMDDLNKRGLAETDAMNTLLLQHIQRGLTPQEQLQFIRRWTSRMDCRYHMVLGDPATRLPLSPTW